MNKEDAVVDNERLSGRFSRLGLALQCLAVAFLPRRLPRLYGLVDGTLVEEGESEAGDNTEDNNDIGIGFGLDGYLGGPDFGFEPADGESDYADTPSYLGFDWWGYTPPSTPTTPSSDDNQSVASSAEQFLPGFGEEEERREGCTDFTTCTCCVAICCGFLLGWSGFYFVGAMLVYFATSAAAVWLHLFIPDNADCMFVDSFLGRPHVCFRRRLELLRTIRPRNYPFGRDIPWYGPFFTDCVLAIPYNIGCYVMAGNAHFRGDSFRRVWLLEVSRACYQGGSYQGIAERGGFGNDCFYATTYSQGNEPADAWCPKHWQGSSGEERGGSYTARVDRWCQSLFRWGFKDLPCEQICTPGFGLEERVCTRQTYHIRGDCLRDGQLRCEPHRFHWRSVECLAAGFFAIRWVFQSLRVGPEPEGRFVEPTPEFRTNVFRRWYGSAVTLVQFHTSTVLQCYPNRGPIGWRRDLDCETEEDTESESGSESEESSI